MLSSSALMAQKNDKGTIVFGKTYTKEQVKEMNGVIRCATTEYEASLQQKYPERMTDAQFEAWLAPYVKDAKTNKSQNGGIITIPVVVHVIHNGQAVGVAPNITDNQVISQITVMSQDFRKMSGTPGFNTSPVGADTQIQFALAKVDPNGNPTNGIDRVNLCQASWSTADINSIVKPQTIWDPTQYMNMWSVNFSDNTLLGYAQFPSGSTLSGLNASGGLATTDGVVCNYSTFGSSSFNDGTFLLNAPYDKGRTMTHEVGHFLGLRHIWGDATCGNDFCNDTPTAHTANYTCNKNIVSCNNPSVYEMVENYMDYTNDTCMNIFTVDQNARFVAVMNNSPRRSTLKTSQKDVAIPLFANDAELKFERSCNGAAPSCVPTPGSASVALYNRGTSNITNAVFSYTINGSTQNYTYTGNLAPNKSAIISFPIAANVTSGPFSATITSVNGGADQRATNDSFSTTYTTGNAPVVSNGNYTFTLQNDYFGSEVDWNLTNSAGVIVYSSAPYSDVPNPNQSTPLPAVITQTFVLANDCYTFTINDSDGDGIYNYGGYYNLKNSSGATVFSGSSYTFQQQKAITATVLGTSEASNNTFSIYPNPVTDILNITKTSDKAVYEIYSYTGQLIDKGSIKDGKVNVSKLITGNYLIKIADKKIETTFKFIKR